MEAGRDLAARSHGPIAVSGATGAVPDTATSTATDDATGSASERHVGMAKEAHTAIATVLCSEMALITSISGRAGDRGRDDAHGDSNEGGPRGRPDV